MNMRNHRKSQLGVATLELAIIISVALAPLIWMAIEGASVFYQYDIVVKNVRVASRYLANYPKIETSANNSIYEQVAKNMVRCGVLTTAVCNSPVVPSLSNATISVTYTTNEVVAYGNGNNSASLSYVTVSVSNFSYSFFSNYFNQSLFRFSAPISASFPQANI